MKLSPIAPRTHRSSANRRLLLAVLMLWHAEGYLRANPIGGEVVAGRADIKSEGAKLTIRQYDDRTILNWQDFSIASGELTKFLQPGASSAVLNRVVSGKLSQIYGTLEANGKVYLINPNGIVVGPSGVINTAGFVASTLDVTNQEFLAGGDMTFRGNSTAKVINMGKIGATDSDVILIAQEVQNLGQITAPNGTVAMAAGSEVLVKASGTERVFVQAGKGSVQNSGLIEAAAAELKAAGGNEYALAINNSGVVRANGVVNQGGRILLKAGAGTVRNSGTLSARTRATKGVGPTQAKVEVYGPKVELTDTSVIEALGAGLVETSGQELSIAPGAKVDTRAADGTLGTWLLDPTDMEIINSGGGSLSGSSVAPSAIVTALNGANVTLQATNSITVTDAINASGNASAGNLTLQTTTLHLNAAITLAAGSTLSGTATTVNVGATGLIQNGVDAAAAGGTVNLAGTTYTLPGAVNISKNLTLQGVAGSTVLDAHSASRVLNLSTGTIVVDGLTLTNGSAVSGGGVYVSGGANVTLRNSTISNNRATNNSGSGVFGGGMAMDGGTTVLVDKSTFAGNTARFGGIIDDYGSLTVTNSTFSGNSASSSGGVYINPGASATIRNSTIANNTSSGFGSGLDSDGGTLVVTNSTIIGNSGANGGGIYSSGNLTLGNVLIVGNTAGTGANISAIGTVTSQGYNLFGSSNGFTGNGTTDIAYSGSLSSLVQTNGGSAVLASNGGPTKTIALVIGSAAYLAGGSNPGGLLDQRGVARGSTISIGAYDAVASTFSHVVTTTADNTVIGSTAVSLRTAIWSVNNGYGAGTAITFDTAGTFATAQTITLSLGELAISTGMSITGTTAGVTINANQASRVMNVSGTNVTLDRLTLTGGRVSGAPGGGIYQTAGSLTITNSTISGNTSTDSSGGGIYSYGSSLSITNSTLSGNSSFNYGGGVEMGYGTGLTILNSTIANNTSQYGGGLDLDHTPTTITNTTISGNTVTGDSNGGGIYNYLSTVTVKNSIIAGNTATTAPDVANTYVDGGHNLIGIADPVYSGFTDPTSLTGTAANPLNAGLAALGNYGGPTQTFALLPGSPALNAGSATGTDQRGYSRVGTPDIGAFESQGFTYSVVSGSGQSAELNQAFAAPLIVGVTANNPLEPVAGGLVTLTLPSTGASATGTLTQIISNLGQASFSLTANTTLGTYHPLVANDGTTSFTLTNAPITLTVTADSGLTKVYGDSDPAFTYTYTGNFLTGDSFSGALSRDAGEDVNTYNITQGTLTAGSNYSIVYHGSTFSITARPLTVTAGSGSSTYGDSPANPGISVTGGSLANGDTLLSLGLGNDFNVTNLTNAGDYAIHVTGSAGSNYQFTAVDGLWKVAARDITVTAGSGSSTYGDAATDPGVSVTSGILQNGDTLTSLGISNNFAITPLTNARNYTIQVVGGVNGNYNFTKVDGTWIVTPRTIRVTADPNQGKIAGTVDPRLTYHVDSGGLVNGDTLIGSLLRSPGEAVGFYAILQGSLAGSGNYIITYVPAQFTIFPGPQTVLPPAPPTLDPLTIQLALAQLETPADVRHRDRYLPIQPPSQVFFFQGWRQHHHVLTSASSASVGQ